MLKIYIRKKEELDELKAYFLENEKDLHERIKRRERKNDEKFKESLRKSYTDHPEYIQNLQNFRKNVERKTKKEKKKKKKKSGRPSET